MTLDQEDIQAIVKAIRESMNLTSFDQPPLVTPLQQAIQLARQGKLEESKALIKAYSKIQRRKAA